LALLPAARVLHSRRGDNIFHNALRSLSWRVGSKQKHLPPVAPLLSKVIEEAPDEEIWDIVDQLVTENTPPPRSPPYEKQTPSKPTSNLCSTTEGTEYIDIELKKELHSSLYVNVPGFFDAFFSGVPNLLPISEEVFNKCQQEKSPLFQNGRWRNWPHPPDEHRVLDWLKSLTDQFLNFARMKRKNLPNGQRRLIGHGGLPLSGTIAKRQLDVGFTDTPETNEDDRLDWSQILIPGEMKSNAGKDTLSGSWLDLAKYARQVFKAQPTRRFIHAFTLCGSIMRLWEFDRLGGIASSPFDIHKEGLQFVSAMLGYLWMNDEQLGFDPTITKEDGTQYITINRNGKVERLIILETINRQSSLTNRGTTCWAVCREGDKSNQVLVVKDSWQYPDRPEEGNWFLQALNKGVVNVARYYHHETVRIHGKVDDITSHVRNGLDITKAKNAMPHPLSNAQSVPLPPGASGMSSESTLVEKMSSSRDASLPLSKSLSTKGLMLPPGVLTSSKQTGSRKRLSSPSEASLPSKKRLREASSPSKDQILPQEALGRVTRSMSKAQPDYASSKSKPLIKRAQGGARKAGSGPLPPRNRVHRRVVVQDYGKNLYKASSPAAMLIALEGTIIGR
jgi:Fungal protein kinase